MALDAKSPSDRDKKPNFLRSSPFNDDPAENGEDLKREAFNDDLPVEDPDEKVIDLNESDEPEESSAQPPAAAAAQVQAAPPTPPKPPVLRTAAAPALPPRPPTIPSDGKPIAQPIKPRPSPPSENVPASPTPPWKLANQNPPRIATAPGRPSHPPTQTPNLRATPPAQTDRIAPPAKRLNGPVPVQPSPRTPISNPAPVQPIPRTSLSNPTPIQSSARPPLSNPTPSPASTLRIKIEADPTRQFHPLRNRMGETPASERPLPSIRPAQTSNPPKDAAPASPAEPEKGPSMTALSHILPLRPASQLPRPPEKIRPQADPEQSLEETNPADEAASQPPTVLLPSKRIADLEAAADISGQEDQKDGLAQVTLESTPQINESPAVYNTDPLTAANDVPAEPEPLPLPRNFTLADLLDRFKHVPAHTAIVGVCDDGAPILFDLLDDRTGPLLVLGDHRGGNTALLQTIIETAIAYNPAEDVRFLVITSQPREYVTLAEKATRTGHCLGIFNSQESNIGEQILRAVGFAEQRYAEGKAGPPILLILDDLQFILKMDSDVRLDLEWLLKNGPTAHIWPLAALSTSSQSNRTPNWRIV